MKRLSGEFANSINKPFLEPLEEYRPSCLITCLALEKDLPKFLLGSIQERCLESNILLKPCKLCWPDRIPNWLLREYADLMVFAVCRILNVLFKEQRLPRPWKLVNVTTLHKNKPQRSHSRGILDHLTHTMCLVESRRGVCVVYNYIKPAVLNDLDMNLFGALTKSSTTLALLDMLHDWSKGTNGKSPIRRTVLFDKALI